MKAYAADSRLFPGLLVLLIGLTINLAPLALGSNRPLPWSYNALLTGLFLAMAASWQLMPSRQGSGVSLGPVTVPLLLFALVISWIGFQTFALPDGSLPNPIWPLAAGLESSIANRSISVNPMNSADTAMRFLTYASVFLSVYLLASNSARASVFLWAFVTSACLFAVYGLARYGVDWEKILWYESINSNLTGPFVNQNNAATYFGLALVCVLGLLLQAFRKTERSSRNSSLRYRFIAAMQGLPGRTGLLLMVFIILLVALLLTGSRAGIGASIAGCMTLIVLRLLKNGRNDGQGAQHFAGLLFMLVLVAVIFEMSGGRFAQRMLSADIDAGGRFDVYLMTWNSISDNAMYGTGAGTFQDVFPVYRDQTLGHAATWDKAHNDYLELFLGLGIPAASMFLLALFLVFLSVLRGYFRRRRDSIYCGIAVSSTVLVALHAMVDFSLQIQAVAMAFAMLLGLGVAQSQSSRSASG